jgi:hypothetical protein
MIWIIVSSVEDFLPPDQRASWTADGDFQIDSSFVYNYYFLILSSATVGFGPHLAWDMLVTWDKLLMIFTLIFAIMLMGYVMAYLRRNFFRIQGKTIQGIEYKKFVEALYRVELKRVYKKISSNKQTVSHGRGASTDTESVLRVNLASNKKIEPFSRQCRVIYLSKKTYDFQKILEYRELMRKLPKKLRKELFLATFRPLIAKFAAFFHNFSWEFIISLMSLARLKTYAKSDILVVDETPTDRIFLFFKGDALIQYFFNSNPPEYVGSLCSLNPEGQESILAFRAKPGFVFNILNKKSKCLIQADCTDIIVYEIFYRDLKKLKTPFPRDYLTIKAKAKEFFVNEYCLLRENTTNLASDLNSHNPQRSFVRFSTKQAFPKFSK